MLFRHSALLSPPRCLLHVLHTLLSYPRLHSLSHIFLISQGSLCSTTVPRERALVSAASCLTKDPSVSPLRVSSAATPTPFLNTPVVHSLPLPWCIPRWPRPAEEFLCQRALWESSWASTDLWKPVYGFFSGHVSLERESLNIELI